LRAENYYYIKRKQNQVTAPVNPRAMAVAMQGERAQ